MPEPSMRRETKPVRDLLITAIETNHHHGVGILLQRMFGAGEAFVCLRTSSLHGGNEPFGAHHHELCSRFLTDAETEDHLRAVLDLYEIRRILVVPYYREEFVHGVLAKRLTGAPLCTYLMDDQNIFAPHVPDRRVADLLEASDLCFGISPEMCAAYAAKFGHPIHLLPPLVEPTETFLPNYWAPGADDGAFCAMLGNVWTARRFEQLRQLAREAGLRIHWYGNGPKASWLDGTPEEWEADGIETMGFLPEEDLVAAIASYPFVLLPSGSLDDDDDNPAFSRLSLPSRLLFLHARTDTPVLVLGHPETAAGRFVRHLGSGVCCNYAAAELRMLSSGLQEPVRREQLRAAVRGAARHLTMTGGGEWLWDALEERTPRHAPFHAVFAPVVERDVPPIPRAPDLTEAPGSGPAAFAVSRLQHFKDVPTLAALSPDEIAAIELSLYQAHLVAHLLGELSVPRGDVLFLGEWLPDVVRAACNEHRLWRIRDLAAWRAAGFSGDAGHLEQVAGAAQTEPRFPQFDAILSTGWLGQLPDDYHVLEGASLYLAACTKPGGWNFHAFSGVLNVGFAWVGPAHPYLKKRFALPANWPGLDDLQRARDPFFMSEAAYERHWQATVGKTYAEFGRVFSLLTAWQKASA